MTISFPAGALSSYFEALESASPVVTAARRSELLDATNGLVQDHLASTIFARGILDLAFLRAVPAHTIFSRKNRGCTPYLLTELADDLREGTVSRETIDETTERAIHSLLRLLSRIPRKPLPLLIEDSSASRYLVLEGNKRLSAATLAHPGTVLPRLEAYVGCSTLTWSEILKRHKMEPAV